MAFSVKDVELTPVGWNVKQNNPHVSHLDIDESRRQEKEE